RGAAARGRRERRGTRVPAPRPREGRDGARAPPSPRPSARGRRHTPSSRRSRRRERAGRAVPDWARGTGGRRGGGAARGGGGGAAAGGSPVVRGDGAGRVLAPVFSLVVVPKVEIGVAPEALGLDQVVRLVAGDAELARVVETRQKQESRRRREEQSTPRPGRGAHEPRAGRSAQRSDGHENGDDGDDEPQRPPGHGQDPPALDPSKPPPP